MAQREAFPAPGDSSTTQGIAPVTQVSASYASCPVCSRSMPLTKTGALRVHGPLSNRCAGSGMLLSSQGPQYLRSTAGNGGASGDLSSQSPSELLLSPNIRQSVRVLKRLVLQKKEGGVRPIAVGLSLRRLVAKCAGLHVMRTVGAGLAPLQLGCGVSLGCEAAAHAARLYQTNFRICHRVTYY